MKTLDELFVHLDAKLIHDDIGSRKYSVNLLGHEYTVELSKDNVESDGKWYYSVWYAKGTIDQGNTPGSITSFARLLQAKFNQVDEFGNTSV